MSQAIKLFLLCLILAPILVIEAQEAESGYRVVEVIDLGLISGPGITSTYLSPAGSRYAYFSSDREICLYDLPENEVDVCYALGDDMRPNLETVRWSPNGQYIAFSDNNALQMFRDSDIQLLDIEQGELRNLSEDDYAGSVFLPIDEDDISYNIDLAVAWSNANQLAILRYPGNSEGLLNTVQVIGLDLESTEIAILSEDEFEIRGVPYATIAWFDNTIALGRSPSSADDLAWGVDLFGADTGELEREILVSENLNNIFNLQFSATGDYLLAYNPFFRGQFDTRFDETELDGVSFIDLSDDTDSVVDIDRFVMQAGFAPDSNAIAYIVQTIPGEDGSGLYIAAAPGEEGELVLAMDKLDAPTSISYMHLTWASNNTIILRDNETFNALLVVLEAIE